MNELRVDPLTASASGSGPNVAVNAWGMASAPSTSATLAR